MHGGGPAGLPPRRIAKMAGRNWDRERQRKRAEQARLENPGWFAEPDPEKPPRELEISPEESGDGWSGERGSRWREAPGTLASGSAQRSPDERPTVYCTVLKWLGNSWAVHVKGKGSKARLDASKVAVRAGQKVLVEVVTETPVMRLRLPRRGSRTRQAPTPSSESPGHNTSPAGQARSATAKPSPPAKPGRPAPVRRSPLEVLNELQRIASDPAEVWAVRLLLHYSNTRVVDKREIAAALGAFATTLSLAGNDQAAGRLAGAAKALE